MALAITEFLENFQLLPKFDIYIDDGSYFTGNFWKRCRDFWVLHDNSPYNSPLVRTLCSEFEIAGHEIYKPTGLMMHVLNNSPSPIKANYTLINILWTPPLTTWLDSSIVKTSSQFLTARFTTIRMSTTSLTPLMISPNWGLRSYCTPQKAPKRDSFRHNAPTLQH